MTEDAEAALLQHSAGPNLSPSNTYKLEDLHPRGQSGSSDVQLQHQDPKILQGSSQRSRMSADANASVQKEANGSSLESQTPQNVVPPNEEKTLQAQQGVDQVKDETLVLWDGPQDPQKPLNYSVTKKWLMVVSSGFMTFTVSFGSSVFSTTLGETSVRFGVSEEVMTLGVALYVFGFGVGKAHRNVGI